MVLADSRLRQLPAPPVVLVVEDALRCRLGVRPVHDEGVGVDDEGEAAGVERRAVHDMLDVRKPDCGADNTAV